MESATVVDYLVVGSGIAGLWFAWKASSNKKVLIVTKKDSLESNTNYAQGGIAAAVAEDDDPKLHYQDTIRVGSGLAHPEVVALVTAAGPRLVRELSDLGIEFSAKKGSNGRVQFDLGQEGGHQRRRIIHARDATGFEIERGLLKAVRTRKDVTIWEEHFTVDLVLDQNGICCGADVLDKSTGKLKRVYARVCLLATGGVGQVYRHTTNPAIATGDGIAMAYRAGARIANMEFIQFHPTTLFGHRIDDRVFLISEAVRGEGAVLRTTDGKDFMPAYHPDGSLAPRDVVARAIAAELTRRGEEFVLLDCTGIAPSRLRERFPNIYKTCLDFGIDITREPIPVVPAAHYVCGGIVVNTWGETSIKRLFAAGECACTGLHGANRLASNSLLEALVFAERAAMKANEEVKQDSCAFPDSLRSEGVKPFFKKLEDNERAGVDELLAQLRDLMWRDAGIVRSDTGLKEADAQLTKIAAQASLLIKDSFCVPVLELRNMLTVAKLIITCASRRLESRGLHYNRDHPFPDERFEKDTVVSWNELNFLL